MMIEIINGGVCAAKGFKAGGIVVGIKKSNIENNKKDLAIIYCEKECVAAAVYTQNKVKGAPIAVTQRHLADGKARAVVVNSGNANTCNPDGAEIADKVCAMTARALGINENDVIIASTGVIGQKLSLAPFETGIPKLAAEISDSAGSSEAACDAIMTTDTRRKEYAVEYEHDGVKVRVGGICKGSGMINPNMATLLVFVTTDAVIGADALGKVLRKVSADTFNMVSVDGDTSTNDMACVMASGLAGNAEITEASNKDEGYMLFENALYEVMGHLAIETARDGEGATKLIICRVCGAPDKQTARNVAKTVISSSLLKAALSAADANWGRILCAVGYSDGDFDVNKAEVKIAGIVVCKDGAGVEFSEEKAFKLLSKNEIRIDINLYSGEHEATAFGCDLTCDYVKINADYRS